MTFNDAFSTNPGPLRSAGPIFVKMNSMKVADIYKYQVAKLVME